jgi:hypothetical protein
MRSHYPKASKTFMRLGIFVHELDAVQSLRYLARRELIFMGFPEASTTRILAVMTDPMTLETAVLIGYSLL